MNLHHLMEHYLCHLVGAGESMLMARLSNTGKWLHNRTYQNSKVSDS